MINELDKLKAEVKALRNINNSLIDEIYLYNRDCKYYGNYILKLKNRTFWERLFNKMPEDD